MIFTKIVFGHDWKNPERENKIVQMIIAVNISITNTIYIYDISEGFWGIFSEDRNQALTHHINIYIYIQEVYAHLKIPTETIPKTKRWTHSKYIGCGTGHMLW